MAYKYKVFISYRRDDAAFMDYVYNILNENIEKEKIFVDRSNLYDRPNEWSETIETALRSSEYIVICVNKDSFHREPYEGKTDWYNKEITIALDRQMNENRICVIPVINIRPDYSETQFPQLSKLQDVCYRSSDKLIFKDRLLKILNIENKNSKYNAIPSVINNITYPKNLIPRFDMLNKVWYLFYEHDCVVVSGIGGSGKTSLAYLYVQERDFNNVAWITINGKIEDAFLEKMSILIYKNEDERKDFIKNPDNKSKLEIIKNKLSNIQGNNFLVLDINTDNDETKQEIKNRIYRYLPSENWQTLVLTRTYPKNKNRFASLEMDKMTVEESKNLFTNYYDGTISFSDEQLNEIVKELYYHPLLIEQTAIVFSEKKINNAEEIINNIKTENKVKNKRTNEILSGLAIEEKEEQDIYTYLINLCDIRSLSDDEKNVLAIYVTWPIEPIDYEVTDTLMPDTGHLIIKLIKKGILSHNGVYTSIHSLVADVLREQIKIAKHDYNKYLDNIVKILDDEIKSILLHKYSRCLVSSFIKYGICNDIILFRRLLEQLWNNSDPILYNLPEPEFSNIINTFAHNSNQYLLADLYNDIARVEEFRNHPAKAKNIYENALEIINRLDKNNETLCLKSVLLNNLALLEIQTIGLFDSAKNHLIESLEIDKAMPRSPENLDSIAYSLNNLALLEYNIGEYDSAKDNYQETLKIRRELPDSPNNSYETAKILHNLAMLEKKVHNQNSAKLYYEEALKIDIQLPESPEHLMQWADHLYQYADIEKELGYISSAKNYFNESLQIYKRLNDEKSIKNIETILAQLSS